MVTVTVTSKPTKSVTRAFQGSDFTTQSTPFVDITGNTISTPNTNAFSGKVQYVNADSSNNAKTRLVVGTGPTVKIQNPTTNLSVLNVDNGLFNNSEGSTQNARYQASSGNGSDVVTVRGNGTGDESVIGQGKFGMEGNASANFIMPIKVNINLLDFVSAGDTNVNGMGSASGASNWEINTVTIDNVVTLGISFNLVDTGVVLYDFTGDNIDVGP